MTRMIFLVAFALFSTLPAWSAEPASSHCADTRQKLLAADSDLRRLAHLQSMSDSGCIGGHADTDKVAARLDEKLDSLEYTSDGLHYVAAADFAQYLAARADTQAKKTTVESIKESALQLRTSLVELSTHLRSDLAGPLPSTAIADEWLYEDKNIAVLSPSNRLTTSLTASCAESQAICIQSVNETLELLRISNMAKRALENLYYRGSEITLSRELATANKEWHSYFQDTRVQMPWELVANSFLYERAKDEYCENPGGFCRAPTFQVMAFHPSIALEYMKDAPSGQRVEEALVLEVIGFNTWSYTENGDVEGGLGVSAIAIASDRANGDDIAYGVMFHFRNTWSLGVTRHNGDSGYFLSYDLWQAAESRTREWKSRFTK